MEHIKAILVIEEGTAITDNLKSSISNSKSGLKITACASLDEAREILNSDSVALIIFDLEFPEVDHLAFLSEVRKKPRTGGIPLIAISNKLENSEIVGALEAGASDYIGKPFSTEILLTRVTLNLNKQSIAMFAGDDNLRLDFDQKCVAAGAEIIELEEDELFILDAMIQLPGVLLTPYQIAESVRRNNLSIEMSEIIPSVKQLRRKLGSMGRLIENIVGTGFRYNPL